MGGRNIEQGAGILNGGQEYWTGGRDIERGTGILNRGQRY